MPGLKTSMPRFCNSKAVGNYEARGKAMQDTLVIHYDDLGSYKELLHLIEAKAWRVNELVIFTIHLAEVPKM
jgi:hypothetical protein